MTSEGATKRFREADGEYRKGYYAQTMEILDRLEVEFPRDRNLMYARARTLGNIGRENEALALCDRLVTEFGYSRAARLQVKLLKQMTEQADAHAAAAPELLAASDSELRSVVSEKSARRFQVKPVRWLLLIVLVALTLMKIIHPFTGVGIVVVYFIINWMVGAAVRKLFMAPFKMKAKALAGATANVHGVMLISNPDLREIGDDDERGSDLRYVSIDVTVQPQARSGGFTHWEPGELALAPKFGRVQGVDDLDRCFNVVDVKVIHDGVAEDDEGYKYHGPARVKLLVGLPHGAQAYHFVYYTESFGMVSVPA